MALQSPEPGNYYEFDAVCNAGALVVFHVHQHCDAEEITSKQSGRKSTVTPVVADILVLDGPQAKTVVRREKIIGKGITGSLRRVAVGNDGVFRMAWGSFDGRNYPQANAVSEQDMATAQHIFTATGGDPYTACERAANPTATLATVAPPAQVVHAPAQQAETPPWEQPAAATVGGPSGPGWDQSPVTSSTAPATSTVW